MQTQEKQRILTQLKSLRQQSLTEYLGTNLKSLANHQVIEDILSKFISTHEDEFLTNVSNSIVEVKEQYRAIKKQLKEKEEQQNLIKLKIQNDLAAKYEAEMEEFFQKWLELQQLSFEKSAEKNPSKAIKKLFDQLNSQKSKTNQLQQKKLFLSQQLQSKQNKIQALSQELQTLQNHITLINQKLDSKELLNKSLEEQVYQKHIKLQETQVIVKEMEEKLINSKEMMNFLENKACSMREESVRLKHHIQLMEKEKEKIDLLLENSKRECEKLRYEKNIFQENQKKIFESIESLKVKVENTLGENTELSNQVFSLKTQILALEEKLKSSQNSIERLSGQKAKNSTEIKKLDTELKQSLNQLQSSTIQNQSLKRKIEQKEVMMKNYLDQKDQQIKKIEEELKQLKEEVEQKQQQEKQYELYLEEIVELRQKIKSLTPAKYETSLQTDCFGRPTKLTNKRTKIYFLLTQVQNKFIQIKSERSQLLKSIIQQIQDMKDYANKAVGLMLTKAKEIKMRCEYCEMAKTSSGKTGITKNLRCHDVGKKDALNGQYPPSHEQEYQKTREFSYKPSNALSQNNQNQSSFIKSPQYLETKHMKLTGSRGMTKNLRHINQKMKAINQENSMYQMHLSRLISESNLH